MAAVTLGALGAAGAAGAAQAGGLAATTYGTDFPALNGSTDSAVAPGDYQGPTGAPFGYMEAKIIGTPLTLEAIARAGVTDFSSTIVFATYQFEVVGAPGSTATLQMAYDLYDESDLVALGDCPDGFCTSGGAESSIRLSSQSLNRFFENSVDVNESYTMDTPAVFTVAANDVVTVTLEAQASARFGVVSEAFVDPYLTFVGAHDGESLVFNSDFTNAPGDIKPDALLGNGVPEPATWGLMLLGFGGLGVALRARGRSINAGA